MRKNKRNKALEPLEVRAEIWAKEAVDLLDEGEVISIFLYDKDESFITLTDNIPSMIFIFKELNSKNRETLKKITAPFDNTIRPFFFSEQDFHQINLEFPLDLLAMKNGAVHLYGEEVLNRVDINRDSLKFATMRDLRSVHMQLVSLSITCRNDELNRAVFSTIRRLLPPFRGVLALRNASVSTSWGSLVSAVESSCSISGFPFTKIISLLENGEKKELSLHTDSLISALENLLTTVSAS
jgi:hypothetical protein